MHLQRVGHKRQHSFHLASLEHQLLESSHHAVRKPKQSYGEAMCGALAKSQA